MNIWDMLEAKKRMNARSKSKQKIETAKICVLFLTHLYALYIVEIAKGSLISSSSFCIIFLSPFLPLKILLRKSFGITYNDANEAGLGEVRKEVRESR